MSVGLLCVVVVCLAIVVTQFPDPTIQVAGSDEASEDTQIEGAHSDDAEEDGSAAPEGVPSGAPSATLSITELQSPSEERRLYIVIDDVGNNLDHLERFLDFPVPLTFAVMPQRVYTNEAARRIRNSGNSIILHQPMEAVNGENPGDGALYTYMSREDIYSLLDRNLLGLKDARGINNHMGSMITQNFDTMKIIMEYLAERKLFFLDSVTTAESVGELAAEDSNVPYAKRNSAFLDNDDNYDSIKAAFDSGLEKANQNGFAILIGHVHSTQLLNVLRDVYEIATKEGYTFSDLNEFPDLLPL